MAKLVSVFISPTYRRMLGLLVWLLSFAAILGGAGVYAVHKIADERNFEARLAGEQFLLLERNLASTLQVMKRDLTAAPCSQDYARQLRRIAYLPDGLSEFMYAPGGQVRCSVSNASFEPAVDLGTPDIARDGTNGYGALWVDRDLAFLGLAGERGSILLVGDFAIVIPPQTYSFTGREWMSIEVALVGENGAWWHRGGDAGVYQRVGATADEGLFDGVMSDITCDAAGLYCIASEVDLRVLAGRHGGLIAAMLAVAAVIAACVTGTFNAFLTRYWSFDARFRRHLDADSIVCAYQPVMELDTGEISGCEVLARWRDIDDRIVFPDRFIDVVERHELTLRFTELVAQRACEELSRHLPAGQRMQVNFNIFPRDLDAARLARVFSGFTSQPDRFDVVLEIIESDAIPPNAQREIEALRRHGIKTYIDDFGTGYSNMQNLAALSVDGVKLDRAFAMAPDNSMMAQMLRHAVEMIHATGRVMVVEGVETADRLALLRRMQGRVDFVQGYFISRPLDIAGFVAFMTPQPVSLAERMKKAGIAAA